MIQIRQVFHKAINKVHQKLDQHHDRRLNIETSEVINISELDEFVDFSDYEIDELYSATPMVVFDDLHSLITQEEKIKSTYIDVGCGKGRALVKGLEYGFKNLIGVEFVPSIAEEAQRNINKIVKDRNSDASFEIICQDIRTYQYPKNNLILYLYNPFDPVVFKGFLENLISDLNNDPRHLTLIYYHTHCDDLLDDCPELERLKYSLLPRLKLKVLAGHRYGAWKYKL